MTRDHNDLAFHHTECILGYEKKCNLELEVVEDDKFPDGTGLKMGTKVVYAIYAMGRMDSVWGKDCKEFKTERWLRNGRYTSESTYKFRAFNGGPRFCLGKDFGLLSDEVRGGLYLVPKSDHRRRSSRGAKTGNDYVHEIWTKYGAETGTDI